MTLQAEVAMRQEGKPGMSDEEVRLFNLIFLSFPLVII